MMDSINTKTNDSHQQLLTNVEPCIIFVVRGSSYNFESHSYITGSTLF